MITWQRQIGGRALAVWNGRSVYLYPLSNRSGRVCLMLFVPDQVIGRIMPSMDHAVAYAESVLAGNRPQAKKRKGKVA